MESGESYWNIILLRGNVISGTFSIKLNINCDWENFFPKLGKWLTPIIKDKMELILTHHLNYEKREYMPLH